MTLTIIHSKRLTYVKKIDNIYIVYMIIVYIFIYVCYIISLAILFVFFHKDNGIYDKKV